MDLAHGQFKAKLLWQVCDPHHKAPPAEVVQSLAAMIEEWDLAAHQLLVPPFVLEVQSVVGQHLLGIVPVELVGSVFDGVLSIVRLPGQILVVVDGLQGTLHQFASLQQVVYLVREDRLPVAVALDLEQELAARHSRGDFDHASFLVSLVSVKG